MRGPAGTGRGGVSMAGGRQGHGAGNEEGVIGRRVSLASCCFLEFTVFSLILLKEVASEHMSNIPHA